MGGGGGMRAKQAQNVGGAQLEDLRKSILDDETISDTTKSELRQQLGGSADAVSIKSFNEAVSEFEQAKEGKSSKFKSRQFQKNLATTLSDRPGSSQTILTR